MDSSTFSIASIILNKFFLESVWKEIQITVIDAADLFFENSVSKLQKNCIKALYPVFIGSDGFNYLLVAHARCANFQWMKK